VIVGVGGAGFVFASSVFAGGDSLDVEGVSGSRSSDRSSGATGVPGVASFGVGAPRRG
jgi:hypothetical protein